MLLANKLREKVPDPRNAKKHYRSFIRKKNRKLVKQSEMITYQPKIFENPNIIDIKLVTAKHPKSSHKLSNTIRQAEKVASNSSLCNDTSEKFLNEKNITKNKTRTCF